MYVSVFFAITQYFVHRSLSQKVHPKQMIMAMFNHLQIWNRQHLHIHQVAFVRQGPELVCLLVQGSLHLEGSQLPRRILGQIPQTPRPCKTKTTIGV
jgi:hypothetical protein